MVSQDVTIADGVDAVITLRRSPSEAGLCNISTERLPDAIEQGTLSNRSKQQTRSHGGGKHGDCSSSDTSPQISGSSLEAEPGSERSIPTELDSDCGDRSMPTELDSELGVSC